MHLSQVLLLTGAALVTAHPSAHAHAHMHRRAHEKRTDPVFVMNVNPHAAHSEAPVAAKPTPAAAAAAAPAPKPAPAAEPKTDYIPFCSESGGVASKEKRVELYDVMYTGNLGMANKCPYNSNIMVVPNSISHLYKYVQTYTNVDSVKYQVLCSNKMGAEPGQLTGMFYVKGQNLVTFDLAPGETKTVVSQENTQGSCAFAPGTVPKTEHGQYAGVWAETDFGNGKNGAWSGADCSSLVAQAYGMDVPGCRMCQGTSCDDCSDNKCSTIWPGAARHYNAYIKGMEKEDGVGLNIITGAVVMHVDVGYH